MAVSVIIYQQKTRKGLLICKACTDVLWIMHYCLIGGFTGAAVTGIALVREIVFITKGSQSKAGRISLPFFLGLSVICSLLTWANGYSLFAMLGSLMSIVSFWIGEPRLSRILSFPISACMLIYGLSNGSTAILVNEVLVITSSAIALLRSQGANAK